MLLLAACGHGASGAATQVVAWVNDREITIMQLNQVLDTTTTADFGEHSTRAALAALVDEELLVQEAIAAKLDRDPDVLLEMERSRRQALIHAYLERKVYPRQPIPEVEKREYYNENPVLFARRHVYHVATFNTKAKVLSAVLKDDLKGARTPGAVQETLSRHNIQFEFDESETAPEDLPLPLLPEFATAASGDVIAAPLEDGTVQLIAVIGSSERPLTFEQASDRIETWLGARRNETARTDHLAKSRAGAKIAYTRVVAAAEGTR
jgi:EpsD family peptidyl-prolyl cis-trans isomerase